MQILDCTFDAPAQNLAIDEALLEAAEAGESGEVLRFWESTQYFVALGYTNKIETEVDEAACRALEIPILRRVSGGGTVLQGPGSFNYSLILNIEARPELHGVSSSNAAIMERQRDALAKVLCAPVEVAGHTDLTLNNRKFSGNAQRRKRQFLLFHGTLLLDFDLDLLSKVLWMPPIRPPYRADRAHSAFVVNLNINRQSVRSALKSAWNATDESAETPHQRIHKLVAERYERDEWTRRF